MALPSMNEALSITQGVDKIVVEWWNTDHQKLDFHEMIVTALHTVWDR